MFEKRTDLALEVHELHGNDSGIDVEEDIKHGVKVITATVKPGKGEHLAGKRAGKYITIDTGRIWQLDKLQFEHIANVLADELSLLIPSTEGCVLVAGLGNEAITPDSIGPKAVKKLLVTRHIRSIDPNLYETAGFGCIAAVNPGVMGQTGIESAEIIKSICENIKPKCVLVIDALASRRLSRLATTVQISNGGISPGSGVSNRRSELSEEILGIPVIAIGVPTVVDAATLAYDLLEEHNGKPDEAFAEVIQKILTGEGRNMFVTPKDNDVIATETAKLLAAAINIAVHKLGMTEINEYIG